MLFNSYAFLLVFLPLTLIGYQVAGMFHRRAVVAWLGLMSLAFYSYWYPPFVLVLLGSIALNYTAALLISRVIPNKVSSSVLLWGAIVANLAALGYFKYLFPLLNFLGHFAGAAHGWKAVALPLGISFFTFTQIAYLVDLHQGIAKQQDIVSYVLFVTFFPHLIAGPILHHKEMMPQFQQDRRYQLRSSDLAVGFTWFLMGLGKKVLIADRFAFYANAGYRVTGHLTVGAAWETALAYSLQLYFDFSGYSDMALGLARMFSIDFPLNFNSPYKATSVTDYWQRWHMTLTAYIMDYLFTPLQFWVRGRRRAKGKPVNRQALMSAKGFGAMVAFPMLFTMFIAGIWHGAGFQFIVFGLLHGAYLTVNHAWRLWGPKRSAEAPALGLIERSLRRAGAVLITYLAVLVASVFFRADNTSDAVLLVANMLHLHAGNAHPIFAGETMVKQMRAFANIAAGLFIVWFLPNTQELLRKFKPSLQHETVEQVMLPEWLAWSPNFVWGVAVCALMLTCFFNLQYVSTFLYFQF